jgi:hypothetical protein
LQHGGREHGEDNESGVEDIDAAENSGAAVRRSIGLYRGKEGYNEKSNRASECREEFYVVEGALMFSAAPSTPHFHIGMSLAIKETSDCAATYLCRRSNPCA